MGAVSVDNSVVYSGLSPEVSPAAKALAHFVRHTSLHSIRAPSVVSMASAGGLPSSFSSSAEQPDADSHLWGISKVRVMKF